MSIRNSLLFKDIPENTDSSILTTNDKFNQWFSRYTPLALKPKFGGMVRKSVVFLTGTSGAGKTTLAFNVIGWTPSVVSSFYARECDLDEIKEQLSPFEVTHDNVHCSDKNIYPHFNDFLEHLERDQPEIVFIDSLQAIANDDFIEMGEDAGVAHIRKVLTEYIKKRRGVLFLIGHNTKEGEFAGKNKNMQMVDAHIIMECDDITGVRKIYWGKKNRKGPKKSMFYEIQDGTIQFFNPNEYQLPQIESNDKSVVKTKVTVPDTILTPKILCKIFIEQFKNSPEYGKFKMKAEIIIKNTLVSYKNNYKNSHAETHAYFDALKNIHVVAVQFGLITA